VAPASVLDFKVHASLSSDVTTPLSVNVALGPQVQLDAPVSSKTQQWTVPDTMAPWGTHWSGDFRGSPVDVVVEVPPASGYDLVTEIVHDALWKVTTVFGSVPG
jgi:hypothetical protein